jgi:hypothetical protein
LDFAKQYPFGSTPSVAMQFEPSLEPLLLEAKASQLDFLNVELELCSTFVKAALEARKEGNEERFASAKANAVKASESIGRFLHYIPNEVHKASVVARIGELDLAIDGL